MKISLKNHNVPILLGLVAILVGEAVLTGLLPMSRGALFSLLSAKSGPIWTTLGYYFLNYLAVDGFQSFKPYVILKVSLWYRKLRTEKVKGVLWAHDMFSTTYSPPSNSPQRIQEDIKLSYLSRITVWAEYLVSGLILMQLFLINLSEPTLIISALVYALLSVLIALRFNPRLTAAEMMVQQEEATYRSRLVSNLMDIGHLSDTNRACMKSARLRLEYLLFTKLQLGMVAVLPYVVLVPKLMAGKIDLGKLIEQASTFGLIVVNAAILISMYQTLIQGQASEKRVQEIL